MLQVEEEEIQRKKDNNAYSDTFEETVIHFHLCQCRHKLSKMTSLNYSLWEIEFTFLRAQRQLWEYRWFVCSFVAMIPARMCVEDEGCSLLFSPAAGDEGPFAPLDFAEILLWFFSGQKAEIPFIDAEKNDGPENMKYIIGKEKRRKRSLTKEVGLWKLGIQFSSGKQNKNNKNPEMSIDILLGLY